MTRQSTYINSYGTRNIVELCRTFGHSFYLCSELAHTLSVAFQSKLEFRFELEFFLIIIILILFHFLVLLFLAPLLFGIISCVIYTVIVIGLFIASQCR